MNGYDASDGNVPRPKNGSSAVALTPPASATVEPQVADDGEEGTTEIPMGPIFLDFLQSDRGHQLANRGLDLIDGFKRATLDEQAKARALDADLKRMSLRQTWILRTLGLVIVVGAIIGLSATNTLRPEAATILGAVAGYLFAQQAKGSA
jgi:hypothetical protein